MAHSSLDTSIAAYHAEETARRQMGTTFTDEFRPRDVHSLPDPTEHLLLDYADGYPIDKLNRAILPAGASAELVLNAPQSLEWRISTDTAFIAEVYNFYWLGWHAEVDGTICRDYTVAASRSDHLPNAGRRLPCANLPGFDAGARSG